jgi:predicted site-specific integrase-resolvase
MPLFTIADAARAAGVDRATLYRHIKAGKLSLSRDEKGKRGVDAAELARVFPEVSQSVAPATVDRADLLHARLQAAEEKCALLLQQLSAATDREQWPRQQLAELQQRLLPPPKKLFLDRLAETWGRLKTR